MISVNLMDALYAGDDIERSVLSNDILLFCTQLTFDLILSHSLIGTFSDLASTPIGFTTHIGTYFAWMPASIPILPSGFFS